MSRTGDYVAELLGIADQFGATLEFPYMSPNGDDITLQTADGVTHTYPAELGTHGVRPWLLAHTAERPHWHYQSGLIGGYLPNTDTCLGDMSDANAAQYLLAECDTYADAAHSGDVECSDSAPCAACSALAECGAIIADGDYMPDGAAVLVTEWEYAGITRTVCDGVEWEG